MISLDIKLGPIFEFVALLPEHKYEMSVALLPEHRSKCIGPFRIQARAARVATSLLPLLLPSPTPK